MLKHELQHPLMRATLGLLIAFGVAPHLSAEPELVKQADDALQIATRFFRTQISTEGGYLWRYSDDLSRREGVERPAIRPFGCKRPERRL